MVNLEIFNSGWESVDSDYGLGSGDYLEASLSKGETVFLRVTQDSDMDDYTILIKCQDDEE